MYEFELLRRTSADAAAPRSSRRAVAGCVASVVLLGLCALSFRVRLGDDLTHVDGWSTVLATDLRYGGLLLAGALAWSALAAFWLARRRTGWWAGAGAAALGVCCVLLLADRAASTEPAEVDHQPAPRVECRSGGDSSDCPGG